MPIRGDITVNWDLSPRVIIVAAPSAELVIQDLHDTMRSLEDDLINNKSMENAEKFIYELRRHSHKWGEVKITETGEKIWWCDECEATKDSSGV